MSMGVTFSGSFRRADFGPVAGSCTGLRTCSGSMGATLSGSFRRRTGLGLLRRGCQKRDVGRFEVGFVPAGEAAGFEFFEIGDAGGLFPGFDDESDAVDFLEIVENCFGVDADGDIEQAGFHHGEAFEAPIEVGDFLDEAEFGFGGGAEVVDEGVADFLVLSGILVGEEGVFGGCESVADGGFGGLFLAFGGDGSVGLGSVQAGGLLLGLRAGRLGDRFGIHDGSFVE